MTFWTSPRSKRASWSWKKLIFLCVIALSETLKMLGSEPTSKELNWPATSILSWLTPS